MSPNFFIVGAPKAGTDELYYALNQHPQIYMSPLKEPCFFADEVRVENFEPQLQDRMQRESESIREFIRGSMEGQRFGGIVSEWEDYLRLFSPMRDEKAAGEGSVCYLWSKTAAAGISARFPGAKIIIVLMDPAERAFAQYLKSLSDGSVSHSFGEHLRICLRHPNTGLGVYHPFLEFGMYAKQVQRYLEHFPAQQFSISLLEESRLDPRSWFAGILKFLEVDPAFVPDAVHGHYHPNVPELVRVSQALQRSGIWATMGRLVPRGVKPRLKRLLYKQVESLSMEPSERATLVDYYRQDIEQLESLLNRDLNQWRRV